MELVPFGKSLFELSLVVESGCKPRNDSQIVGSEPVSVRDNSRKVSKPAWDNVRFPGSKSFVLGTFAKVSLCFPSNMSSLVGTQARIRCEDSFTLLALLVNLVAAGAAACAGPMFRARLLPVSH
jgi:hypothetical protein